MRILREGLQTEIKGKIFVGIISSLLFIAGGVYVYRNLGVLTHHVYFEPPSIISIIASYAPGSLILGIVGFIFGYSLCSIGNAICRIIKKK